MKLTRSPRVSYLWMVIAIAVVAILFTRWQWFINRGEQRLWWVLLVAFLVFVIVGIFGALAWSLVYSRKASTGAPEGNSGLLWLHLILFEVGVLGATALMAAVGYVGGNIVATGGSPIVSAEAIRTQIFPPLSSDPNSVLYDMPPVLTAVFIGLTLLSQLVGYIALFTLKKSNAS